MKKISNLSVVTMQRILRALSTLITFLMVPSNLIGGELLQLNWEKTKLKNGGIQFCSKEVCPAKSICKVRIVKWQGKSDRVNICDFPVFNVTPGSVNTRVIGTGFAKDQGEKLRIGVGGRFNHEIPVSSKKQSNGAWLLEFSNCSIEVKLYGEDF